MTPERIPEGSRVDRRRFLKVALGGAAGVVVVGVAGFELVSHGVLPGQQKLDELDGACSVGSPPLTFSTPGPSTSGSPFSKARNRTVGYTIAYPPGHGQGHSLPMIVLLHGFGGNHTDAVAGMTPEQAVALHVGGHPLPPMAMVTVGCAV
jgi:hypothetical protein